MINPYTFAKFLYASTVGQWCHLVVVILLALCFVGVSGASAVKSVNSPAALVAQGLLGDFESSHIPDNFIQYTARDEKQPAIISPRHIAVEEMIDHSQVVVTLMTLQADNIQVRAKWRVSNALDAFAMEEYGDGELYLMTDINNRVLNATVYLEDEFSLLNMAYNNLRATATIRVEIMAGVVSFAGSVAVIQKPDVLLGQGATLSIILPFPAVLGGLSLSLTIHSDHKNYTITALDNDHSITCADDICALVIAEGQTEARLSVLTQTDMTLSLVVGGSDEFVIKVVATQLICERTPQVRNEIMQQAGKSNCAEVTSENLANITELNLADENITSLHVEDFDGLVNLQELYLTNNTLTAVPNGVFNNLGNLRVLWLASNALTAVPGNAFDNLDKLQELWLSNNALTALPITVFANLDSLQKLYLHRNALTTLPSEVFNNLASLQELALSFNTLTVLPSDVFNNLGNLEILYLCCNSLTTMPHGIFDNLGNLQHLDWSNNDLTSIPNGVFNDLSSLQNLDLAANTLTVISHGIFDNLSSLQELWLNKNYLARLPRGAFTELGNLAFLYLDNNECSFGNQGRALGIDDSTFVNFGSGYDCLALFDAPLLSAVAGLAYQVYNMNAQGGMGAHTYNIIGGNEDRYFAIGKTDGALSLTTTQTQMGQYTLTIQVADGAGITKTAVATVHLAPQDSAAQMADFVSTLALLEKYKAETGDGVVIDIVARYPVQTDSFTIMLSVVSAGGQENYTVTVANNDAVDFSCVAAQCSLIIHQGQRQAQLSVLTQTELSVLMTEGGSGTVVITIVDILQVCDRTPQVRDEIVAQTGKANCAMVTADDLIQISQLNLSQQTIVALQAKDFSGLDRLQRLNLSGNNLTVLSSIVFAGLRNLQHLDLGKNTLTALSASVFAGLDQVRHLHLNDNKLTTVPVSVFASLRNATHLDLHGNNLTDLSAGVFDHLVSLQYLDLHNNDLSTLPPLLFSKMVKLQELNLQGNLDDCSFLEQDLGIGGNVIVLVNYGC